MKETTLWQNVRLPLTRIGKFQKISDRFTPGIPDVLGGLHSTGVGVAIELKELKGVKIIRAKFRPGQLDWLREWPGWSLIMSTHGSTVYIHSHRCGEEMEIGMTPEVLYNTAKVVWSKTRRNNWSDLVLIIEGLFWSDDELPDL